MYDFKNSYIAMECFHRNSKNAVADIYLYNPDNSSQIIESYENLNQTQSTGLEFYTSLKLANWYSIFFNTIYYYYKIIPQNMPDNNRSSYTSNIKLNQTINIKNKFQIKIMTKYQAPKKSYYLDLDDYFYVNIGASVSFFQKRLRAACSFGDVFYTAKYRYKYQLPNYECSGLTYDYYPNIQFRVSYKFEKKFSNKIINELAKIVRGGAGG